MATVYSTGPVLIYVGLPVIIPIGAYSGSTSTVPPGSSGYSINVPTYTLAQLLTFTPAFLGTGKVAPNIRTRRSYAEVKNDAAGPILPFDKIRAGVDAMVTVSLTRYNDPVVRFIQLMSALSTNPGQESAVDRGSLMFTEGLALPLYLVFPFNRTHPAMRAQGMVPGYRFFGAMLEGDADLTPGTGSNELALSWYCGSIYNPFTNGFSCYDYGIGACPILAPD